VCRADAGEAVLRLQQRVVEAYGVVTRTPPPPPAAAP